MTLIWAHARSSALTAFNTLESYAQAVAEGADGLELDVHLTGDGHLVCCHDGHLPLPDGTTLTVGSATVEDLARVEVGDATTGPTRIPLLRDVYELLGPTGMQLNVEVKNLVHRYPGIAEQLRRSLRESGMIERITVSSFQHSLLTELQQHDSAIQTAALYADGLIEPWTYFTSIGISQVHPHFSTLLDPGVLDRLLDENFVVRAWTVDDPALWAQYVAEGMSGIITNDPVGALAARDALAAQPQPR